ncbi:unnamed protein product [Gongylonema pulchrum]|uniref:C2 DOCK-type domain-containing protein n=1 Tax=Gongylonema pulchrum TaxID=637853 RepID=A0A183DPU6_9BILA|nr:unnamed protein product [Gongylonema pulchrum]
MGDRVRWLGFAGGERDFGRGPGSSSQCWAGKLVSQLAAQCNFSWNGDNGGAGSPAFLPLHIGETVTVACTSDDWCYGSSVESAEKYGIFPSCAVVAAGESVPSVPSEAIEIVDELTDVLKEWWNTVKSTYCHQARMECQDKVLLYMEELMGMRKKILSGNVPVEELKEMRTELARKIDLGNQWLGLDMLIRDKSGKKMDCDTNSVIQVYRAHVETANRILSDSKPNETRGVSAYSLLVHALSATVDAKCECEFTLSIYSVNEKKFISENFVFYWSFSTGNLMHHNSRALFTDLGWKEYPSPPSAAKDHRLLLCIRVARIAPIEQTSSTLKKHFEVGPSQHWSRQVHAAAVLDLSDVIAGSHGSTEHIVPLNRDDSLEQLIDRASGARTTFGRAQLMISVEVLPGSLAQIKKMQPQIFSSDPPRELKKLSFADVISAVVYFKSIEILAADRVHRQTTYRSLVFYHDDKPKWNETIKVQIPENIDQNIHLRITFHHKKSFDKMRQEKGPFALAFARIMEGATLIKDGTHELLIYKIDSGRFDDSDTSYTRLPATQGELKVSQCQLRPQTAAFVHGEKNFLTVKTISGQHFRSNLKELLEEISKPRSLTIGEELVKFIPNFCDALFEILDHYPGYDSLVFDALVTLTQLVNEERYKNFRPVLEKYVENFHSTVAFVLVFIFLELNTSNDWMIFLFSDASECALFSCKLLPVLRERIESAEETHERSLNTMKSLGTLIQLIVKSKLCSDRLGLTSNNFRHLISLLLESFVTFMQNKRVRMTCQNMALKHIPAIIPHLTYCCVYDSEDLTDFLVRLMDHLGENISSRCRLNFFRDVVQTEHFIEEENRKKLLPKIVEKVVEELENSNFVYLHDFAAPSLDRSKIDDCITASADIMFHIIERLFCSTVR